MENILFFIVDKYFKENSGKTSVNIVYAQNKSAIELIKLGKCTVVKLGEGYRIVKDSKDIYAIYSLTDSVEKYVIDADDTIKVWLATNQKEI